MGKSPQELALSLPLNFVCLTALYLPPLNYGVYFKTLAFLEITSKEEDNYLTERDDYMLMTDGPFRLKICGFLVQHTVDIIWSQKYWVSSFKP